MRASQTNQTENIHKTWHGFCGQHASVDELRSDRLTVLRQSLKVPADEQMKKQQQSCKETNDQTNFHQIKESMMASS
jgi:hypothetical protein